VIDNRALAAIIDQEIRLRATQTTSKEDGSVSSQERLARQLQKSPLPPTEVLGVVVEELFWASLLAEEGRPCRPRLLYGVLGEGSTGHWFGEPVPLTRETLRKLTPTQGPRGYLSWKLGERGQPVITGIQNERGAAFVVSSPAAGAIDVVWSTFRILTVRGGELHRLSTCALPDAEKVFDVIRDAVGGVPNVLVSTLLAVAEDGHGGSLWVASGRSSLDGVRIGYALKNEPPPLERFADEGARDHWIESVAHLAAVDGAVVLDASARVLGFSAFVETGAPVPLIELLASGVTRRISSPDTGGGRHRSAAEFCRRAAPAAALVVSSDGRISMFAARSRSQPPLFSEVMSLGLR